MMTHYYSSQQQNMQNAHPMMPSSNHHGRSRRGQRVSSTQPNNRHMRHQQHLQQQQQQQQQQLKAFEKMVANEAPSLSVFRARFEAGRSFDLDDDLEFCPNLLTWDERQSMTSGSDRSSLSSGSPDSSPLQHQIQPHFAPALAMSNAAYVSPPTSYAVHNLKLHQPSAIRSRNPIPIVNPDTRTRASPPSSISPGMMQQPNQRRW